MAAPGTVAGLVPWLITRWRPGEGATTLLAVAGVVLIALGAVGLVECFLRFALQANGTPAPFAPTERLVVRGLYRFVRNPMYVAVLLLILGQTLLFANVGLLVYAILAWTAFHVFVVSVEEPRLRHRYAEEYAAYAAEVRRWRPRVTPWRGA